MTPRAGYARDMSVHDDASALVVPFDPAADAPDAVLRVVGDRRIVLLGEASLGTHEYYAPRAAIIRRLIEQGRVDAVAVDAA